MHKDQYTSIMRAAAVMIGLMGIISVHVMDLPGKFSEVPYLGFGYLLVIVAAGVLITRMIAGPTRRDFIASAVLAAAVMVGYAINRTVGMPGATDDIGNWFEPLGLLSLVVEGFVVWAGLAAARLGAAVRMPITNESAAEPVLVASR